MNTTLLKDIKLLEGKYKRSILRGVDREEEPLRGGVDGEEER